MDRAGAVKIDYSLETMPLSTIAPLRLIGDLPENFLLMNGDVLTDLPMGKLYDEHVSQKRHFTIAASERTNVVDYGVLHARDNQLVGFEENPSCNIWSAWGSTSFTGPCSIMFPPARNTASTI